MRASSATAWCVTLSLMMAFLGCRGLLIRGGDVLEAASQVDTVVFDKTGTLTQGQPSLQQVLPAPGSDMGAEHLLAYAAAVERCTTHPVAQAIVQAADSSGM